MNEDEEFPYRLTYAGREIRLAENAARQVYGALQQCLEANAPGLVEIEYLLAGEPLNVLLLGPNIPILLSGPAFSVPDPIIP